MRTLGELAGLESVLRREPLVKKWRCNQRPRIAAASFLPRMEHTLRLPGRLEKVMI